MQLRASQSITIIALLLAILFLLVCGCEGSEKKKRCPGPCKVSVMAFVAEWCAPCKRAKPALIDIQAAGVKVTIVDIDKQPDMAKRYGVTSVPTFFVRAGGATIRTQNIATVQQLAGVSR